MKIGQKQAKIISKVGECAGPLVQSLKSEEVILLLFKKSFLNVCIEAIHIDLVKFKWP